MAALELVVTRAQEGRTVKSLLKGELGLSTTLIGRLKRTETGLTVNGRRVFANAVLREGDRLSVDLPAAERPTELRPVPMALDVRFEDEHLLVVNKPAPLAAIPSSLVPGEPTLAAGLLYHLGEGSALHLVNRLDRGTTGLPRRRRPPMSTSFSGGGSIRGPSIGPIWLSAWAVRRRSGGGSSCPSAGTRPLPSSGGLTLRGSRRRRRTGSWSE